MRLLPAAVVVLGTLVAPLGARAGADDEPDVLSCAPAAGRDEATCSVEATADPAAGQRSFVDLLTGWGPADISSAYYLPSATSGRGQRVYVVEAGHNPALESDLANYRSLYGLPPCTTAGGCLQWLDQEGEATPGPADDVADAWAATADIDVAMVSAACPNCGITVVEADSTREIDLLAAVRVAVAAGARFVSMSWGAADASIRAAAGDVFDRPGVVFTAADSLAHIPAGAAVYPAADPHVVAVGATALSRDDSSPRGWRETAMNFGAVDCDAAASKPAWQVRIPADTCAGRAYADVAVVGRDVEFVWNGLLYYGTAPMPALLAAAYALAGPPAADADPPAELYSAGPDALNDVTDGEATAGCESALCEAGPGWDGPTGLGTPNGVQAFLPPDAQEAPPQTHELRWSPSFGSALQETDDVVQDGARHQVRAVVRSPSSWRSPYQKWLLSRLGDGNYRIVDQVTGDALESVTSRSPADSDLTAVVAAPLRRGDPAQEWRLDRSWQRDGQSSDGVAFFNAATGAALTAAYDDYLGLTGVHTVAADPAFDPSWPDIDDFWSIL